MSNPVILIVSRNSDFHRSLRQRLNEMGCRALCVPNDLCDTTEDRYLNWAEEFQPEVVLICESASDSESCDIQASIIRSFRGQRPIVLLMPEPTGLPPGVAGNAGSDGTVDLDSMVDVVGKLACLRNHQLEASQRISYQGLEIDRRRHQATMAGRDLKLTVTEFQLLWTLAARPGYVHTREQLFESCQRGRNGAQLRTVDAHIKSIRRKLREYAGMVQTIRGIGYCVQENEPAESIQDSTNRDRLQINSFTNRRGVRRA